MKFFAFRYKLQHEEIQIGGLSTLLIEKVEKKDNALFTCSASNDYGEDNKNIQITIQGNKTQKYTSRKQLRSLEGKKLLCYLSVRIKKQKNCFFFFNNLCALLLYVWTKAIIFNSIREKILFVPVFFFLSHSAILSIKGVF